MRDARLSLDVEAPDQVAGVLIAAAERYRESAAELASAWQDKGAGLPWVRIAQSLELAARAIEKAVAL